jgi:hypothetical protein
MRSTCPALIMITKLSIAYFTLKKEAIRCSETFLPACKSSRRQPRGPQPACSPPWEPQISPVYVPSLVRTVYVIRFKMTCLYISVPRRDAGFASTRVTHRYEQVVLPPMLCVWGGGWMISGKKHEHMDKGMPVCYNFGLEMVKEAM